MSRITAIITLGALILSEGASAQLTFCNKTDGDVSVAILTDSGATTTGWQIDSEKCKVVIHDALDVTEHFSFYARMPKHADELKGEWPGKNDKWVPKPGCINDAAATFNWRVESCESHPNARVVPMIMHLPGSSNYEVDLWYHLERQNAWYMMQESERTPPAATTRAQTDGKSLVIAAVSSQPAKASTSRATVPQSVVDARRGACRGCELATSYLSYMGDIVECDVLAGDVFVTTRSPGAQGTQRYKIIYDLEIVRQCNAQGQAIPNPPRATLPRTQGPPRPAGPGVPITPPRPLVSRSCVTRQSRLVNGDTITWELINSCGVCASVWWRHMVNGTPEQYIGRNTGVPANSRISVTTSNMGGVNDLVITSVEACSP